MYQRQCTTCNSFYEFKKLTYDRKKMIKNNREARKAQEKVDRLERIFYRKYDKLADLEDQYFNKIKYNIFKKILIGDKIDGLKVSMNILNMRLTVAKSNLLSIDTKYYYTKCPVCGIKEDIK